MNFNKYIKKIKEDFTQAVKVEWLNPDESVNFEFTNSIYDIDIDLNVNYQSGCRRTCTIKLNNDNNRFPIDFNNIWFGQKFKLWMGIYIDEKTPYYFPQGVFYVSNPNELYNPSTRTITINGIDKWAYLDGTLFGRLSGTYKTNIGVNIYEALRNLLKLPSSTMVSTKITEDNIKDYFIVEDEYLNESKYNCEYYFQSDGNSFYANNFWEGLTVASSRWIAKKDMTIVFDYGYYCPKEESGLTLKIGDYTLEKSLSGYGCKQYKGSILKGQSIDLEFRKIYGSIQTERQCVISNIGIEVNFPIDPIPPLLSNHFLSKKTEITQSNGNKIEQSVLLCPYTATVERGKTFADVILEYATILCANVYYDVNGRFVLEPMIDTADDITDTNKEILWDYTVDEKVFSGLSQTFNFDKVYNDIIVLGNIVNGYQFKGRVQNRNPISNTCVQKIGLKTKEPIEDNQYVSDEQCVELAKYYAKTDTILQKSGNISSITLFHLDVNKLVTISTPNNNMCKELFLITGFSLSTSGTMNLNVTSVNILKDFSVVEVGINE